MFNRKKCKRCGEIVKKDYDFCPSCGIKIKEDRDDWGMLGKNDFNGLGNIFNEIRLPSGLNMIFNSLIKNLENEFRNMDSQIENETRKIENAPDPRIKRNGISISISTSNGKPPEIRVNQFGGENDFRRKEIKPERNVQKTFSEDAIKKFSKLPREEPSTNVRRLSNKVVYEIDLPGVNSVEDVSIIKMENSIEIKAVTKDKAYFKLLPIKLPIMNYKISKGKLILELAGR